MNVNELSPAEQQRLFVQLAKVLYERQDPHDIREGITPHDVLLFNALTNHDLSELRESLRMITYSLECISTEMSKRISNTRPRHRETVEDFTKRTQKLWEQLIAEMMVEYGEAAEAQSEKDDSSPTTH